MTNKMKDVEFTPKHKVGDIVFVRAIVKDIDNNSNENYPYLVEISSTVFENSWIKEVNIKKISNYDK